MEVFCCHCILGNKHQETIQRIPDVLQQLFNAVESQKFKKQQGLLQLKKAEDYLRIQAERVRDENLKKIDTHFDIQQREIEQQRKQAKEKYIKEFEIYSKKLDESFTYTQTIKKHIYLMDFLTDEQENGKITDYCESCTEICNFNNEVTLDNIKLPSEILKIRVKTPGEDNSEIMDNSITIKSELTPHNFEINPEIFDITKYWYCHHCETQNSSIIHKLACAACSTPRPIELFESFFKNYRYATANDLELLEQRKKAENDLICSLNEPSLRDGSYFIMNEAWVSFWEHYIQQKKKYYSLQTSDDHKDVDHVPHPGRINNEKLLQNSKASESISTSQYRIVNPRVWNAFFQIYGGGPIIHREEKKINSTEILIDPIAEEFQSKISKIKQSHLSQPLNQLSLKKEASSINPLPMPKRKFQPKVTSISSKYQIKKYMTPLSRRKFKQT